MRPILNFFAVLAGIGLVISLVSHLYALFNLPGPLGEASWILHVGIFVVWIPAVLAGQSMAKNVPSKDFWKAALRVCPPWMKYLTYGFFGYAGINFVIFMFNAPSGQAATDPGMPPSVVRGFSGHWMAFYSAALAILYSRSHNLSVSHPERCQNGHQISPFAKFCETCGSPVGPGKTVPK